MPACSSQEAFPQEHQQIETILFHHSFPESLGLYFACLAKPEH
jgi:hypothetical protein